MNELICRLALYDRVLDGDEYIASINQLCTEYGTEVVADAMVRLGLI